MQALLIGFVVMVALVAVVPSSHSVLHSGHHHHRWYGVIITVVVLLALRVVVVCFQIDEACSVTDIPFKRVTFLFHLLTKCLKFGAI